MSPAASRLPKRITLAWGRDRLEVDDPVWIAKIAQAMVQNIEPVEGVRIRLYEPYSRYREIMNARMKTGSFGSLYVPPRAPPDQLGYQTPEQQDPVAAEALKVFLGLELPVALNFTNDSGRSEHRMSAVHTAFRQCWNYSRPDELNLCWTFIGYQLYATHHIGTVHDWPYATEAMGHIERRLLNGQWVRWGFDGASLLPAGRRWSWYQRRFIWRGNSIQRVDPAHSDLEAVFDDRELEDDTEDGVPPSQEAI
ncbi:hypothetical protein ACYSUW_14870 [Pseudomonas frederiksbergensis]